MQFKEKFGKKMKERMEQKGIDTKEFAKRLFNYGANSDLCNIPENKKSYDNCIRKVQKWLSGSDEPKNFDELEKICKILDCDSSYLFDEKPVVNFNNKKVADWLGLDEIVVSNIKSYDEIIKKFLSILVRANETNDKLGDILLEFLQAMLLHSDNSSNKIVTIQDTITGEIKELKGDSAIDFIMYGVKNQIESILYKVSIIGMDIGKIERQNKQKEDECKHKEEIEKLMNECIAVSGKSEVEILKDIEKHKTR